MTSQFLYEQWLKTARAHSRELALFDSASATSWTFADLLREADRSTSNPQPIHAVQGSGPEFIFNLLRGWRNGLVTCALDPEQKPPALQTLPPNCEHLKITSASSGPPKCIAFTGPQLAADAANIVSTMGLDTNSPNIACISLAHSYGFSNLILPLLLHGIPLFLVPAPLPELILKTAKQARSVTLPAVPALWKTWHQTKSIPPNISVAISAGAPLPLDLEQQIFQTSHLKIHNFYGSSECGGIAYDRTNTPRTVPNCVGSALDNVRLSLSSTGTLVIESTAVGETYLPEPQPTLRSGRFETTDLAELRDQLVFLHGRASDLLHIAGRKASPDAIESILRTHPAVLECIVFAIQESDDRVDTVVAALNTKSAVPISDLTQFLSQKIPAWQIPRRWWFTPDLAPNNRGKLSRPDWKRRYLESRNVSTEERR
jgi:long-chain acyl-CoA synthetase